MRQRLFAPSGPTNVEPTEGGVRSLDHFPGTGIYVTLTQHPREWGQHFLPIAALVGVIVVTPTNIGSEQWRKGIRIATLEGVAASADSGT